MRASVARLQRDLVSDHLPFCPVIRMLGFVRGDGVTLHDEVHVAAGRTVREDDHRIELAYGIVPDPRHVPDVDYDCFDPVGVCREAG